MSSDIPLASVGNTRKRVNVPNTGNFNENNDNVDPVSVPTSSSDVPDNFNEYRNKKTLTQGLMDISLFSANANQLRYILEYGAFSAPCYIMSTLIILSLILQVGVGVMLLFSVTFNVDDKEQRQKVYISGNNVTIAIFLITVINVFVAAFGGAIQTAPTASGSANFANATSALVNATGSR